MNELYDYEITCIGHKLLGITYETMPDKAEMSCTQLFIDKEGAITLDFEFDKHPPIAIMVSFSLFTNKKSKYADGLVIVREGGLRVYRRDDVAFERGAMFELTHAEVFDYTTAMYAFRMSHWSKKLDKLSVSKSASIDKMFKLETASYNLSVLSKSYAANMEMLKKRNSEDHQLRR